MAACKVSEAARGVLARRITRTGEKGKQKFARTCGTGCEDLLTHRRMSGSVRAKGLTYTVGGAQLRKKMQPPPALRHVDQATANAVDGLIALAMWASSSGY